MFAMRTTLTLGFCTAILACDRSTQTVSVVAPDPTSRGFDLTQADPLSPYNAAGIELDIQAVQPQQAATGGRATGHFELPAPAGNRAEEQYSFTALSTGLPPSAKGQVELHTLFTFGTEATVHIDVDCLVIDGNQAWFSGPAKRYVLGGVPQPPGLYLVFRVQDNGEGAGAPPDLGSTPFGGPPQACALRPLFPMYPTANGNIQVQQR